MEATIVYWGFYRDSGKENGSYHSIMGSFLSRWQVLLLRRGNVGFWRGRSKFVFTGKNVPKTPKKKTYSRKTHTVLGRPAMSLDFYGPREVACSPCEPQPKHPPAPISGGLGVV